MQKNLYISNFKYLPKAFLLSLAFLAITNLLVEHSSFWKISRHANSYRNYLNNAKEEEKENPLLLVGNSRAMHVNCKILNNIVVKQDDNEALFLCAGGAMPRTHLFMFNTVKFKCVKDNNIVLLCLTPMDFNRYNACFNRTILWLFSWKHLFLDLLFQNRMDGVRYYLENCSMTIMRYRYDIKRLIKDILLQRNTSRVNIDKNEVNMKLIEREMKNLKEKYLKDYTVDKYQIEAVKKIVYGIKNKKATPVIVLLPVSLNGREILEENNLKQFVSAVNDIAEKNNVVLLDYISRYKGNEYMYFDGSHFTTGSSKEFSKRLANDILNLLKNENNIKKRSH